jgi:hypothetical protein
MNTEGSVQNLTAGGLWWAPNDVHEHGHFGLLNPNPTLKME